MWCWGGQINFCGLILEGVTGTGKSTLFRLLQRSELFATAESKLFLAQTYTLRMAPSTQPERLLEQLASWLGELQALLKASEFQTRYDGRGSLLYALEGFHYYLALEHLGRDARAQVVREVDRMLSGLGALVVALHLPEEEILERSVVSTKRLRGEKWAAFLRKFGQTDEEVARYYAERQRAFLDLLRDSDLPVLRLDTTSADWPALAAEVERFVRGHTWLG